MHAGHARSTWRNRNKGGNIITGKKLQRLLACLLAVLLLSQVGAFSPAVFAADDSSYTLQDGTAIIKSTMTTKDNKDGSYQVRVAGTETAVTLTKAEKLSSSITLKQDASVKLPYKEDGTLDFDALRTAIFAQVVESTTPELTVDDVTIEYYAKFATEHDRRWVPLEGKTITIFGKELGYPAISAGEQKIKVSYNGSDDYKAVTVETTVKFLDRADAPFQLKEGVTEVSMVYNKDQSINYEATAQALREALLVSADPNVSINDVTVKYKASGSFKPLDYKAVLDSNKFGTGEQTIRFTWGGNADYQAYTAEVTVKMTDTRIVSEVALKTGASITYNMDANVMLQAILDNLVDWDASKLPEKSTLSAGDFTIEYYATPTVTVGNIGGDVELQKWVPIEGEEGISVGKLQYFYPQMGAGEQQIRVTYKGNADYRPSTPIEGNLTVNKAKVSVKVHSTSIYADEELSKDFITTDPADNFDIFTVFGGVTSDVTGSVFVQLPERLTKGMIITAIDKTLEGLHQKTLTQMMKEGTTVGELRKLLSDIVGKGDKLPQDVKDLLKNVGIDIDTLVKLNEALNKFPGLLDNVRVAFGTPDQAGIYTVCAVTNNKNYETGFGMGALVVKKHYSGVKLTWNQNFTNGKISAADVKNFDFGATLSYNGKQVEDQSSVHYLYSGFTSKWKPYSSTSTPPTEPGRYVVTVVTLGGNYQAAPITRAFQITK